MKRKIQPAQPVAQVVKKFRSKRHSRRRSKISPILCSDEKARLVSLPFPVDSTASSHLTREFSCDSSRIPVTKPGNSQKKRSFEEITGFGESSGQNRIVTRSYYRRREKEKKNEDVKEEISESSCVESCSAADAAETISNLTSSRGKGIEDSESSKNNKAACAEKISGKAFRTLFKSGGVEVRESQKSLETKACEVAHISNQAENYDEIRIPKVELPAVSNFNTIDPGLVCSELLCDEVASDYSSAFSDLRSEIFQQSSEIDLSSDYTPSIWLESGSEFSQRSVGDSSPSPTFSLFLQYSQQFCASTFSLDSKFSSSFEDDCSNECRSLKFEDEEHEMSYQMLRKRERKEIYMQDYAEEYCSTTEYGGLVIQQRLQMVHWIVEQTTSKELQKETMFLGVSLLDRFLSTGFFKNKRELQIVGIACLALATRLEENQPFNSVRKKIFCVGSNTYSRCEVVAMEWLVQEVLHFQCFLPTIYNFLWFYLQAAKANEVVEKTAKYLAVLALLGHEQLCFWPSTVAAGLVILASLVANQDESCIRVMETHIRSKEDDLPGCIKSLEWLVKYAC